MNFQVGLKKPINENKLAEKSIFTNNLIIIAIILGVVLLAIFIFIRKR
jgi:subtilase family serine protease